MDEKSSTWTGFPLVTEDILFLKIEPKDITVLQYTFLKERRLKE